MERYVPRRLRLAARKARYLPSDALDLVLRRRDPLTPPKSKSYLFGGNFEEVGQRFLRTLVELGDLKPYEQVLDVGCGIGRVAVPLTGYLSEGGGTRGST